MIHTDLRDAPRDIAALFQLDPASDRRRAAAGFAEIIARIRAARSPAATPAAEYFRAPPPSSSPAGGGIPSGTEATP